MEPLFPSLLFLGPFFAPLIVRVGLAIVFLWDAKQLSRDSMQGKVHTVWAVLLGILFAIGLFTQAAAIAGIIYIFVSLFSERGSFFKQKPLALLAFTMLLVLLISGAGFNPFPFGDLPY